MKHLTTTHVKAAFLFLAACMVQTILWAQDSAASTSTSSTSVTVTKENSQDWLSSPWVWVIGGAVFILLLVALLSNRSGRTTDGRTDRVTVTKTVKSDTDM